MNSIMKKKIGTIIDDGLLADAKQRAVLEKRTLAELIEDALSGYLNQSPGREEALRSLEKFTSHESLLPHEELAEILEEDALSP